MPRDDIVVLTAIRLAERVHREHNHYRKAPKGEDRPPYFIHLAEVAWMLQDARLDPETVAAGYLHDIIEDCGYSEKRLARKIGSTRIAKLVQWVSEKTTDRRTGRRRSWGERNREYLNRVRGAPREVLALSCADKTANMLDMCRYLAKGYSTHDFTSKDHATQLAKFEALDAVYRGRVPRRLYARFRAALTEFHRLGMASQKRRRGVEK